MLQAGGLQRRSETKVAGNLPSIAQYISFARTSIKAKQIRKIMNLHKFLCLVALMLIWSVNLQRLIQHSNDDMPPLSILLFPFLRDGLRNLFKYFVGTWRSSKVPILFHSLSISNTNYYILTLEIYYLELYRFVSTQTLFPQIKIKMFLCQFGEAQQKMIHSI